MPISFDVSLLGNGCLHNGALANMSNLEKRVRWKSYNSFSWRLRHNWNMVEMDGVNAYTRKLERHLY